MVKELLTKKQLTEKEFLGIVDAGIQAELSIGTEITLPNTLGTTDVWVVAGVNHDDAVGTVDLVTKGHVKVSDFSADDQLYEWSSARYWLTGKFIQGFSDAVRHAMKPVLTVEREESLFMIKHDDLVKLPSLTEVGMEGGDPTETPYPLFSSKESRGLSGTEYWVRDKIPDIEGGLAYYVNAGGGKEIGFCESKRAYRPIIRL